MRITGEDLVALVPHLRASARRLAGGDRRLADDLVQDTVVGALRAGHRSASRAELKARLSTILRDRLRGLLARTQAAELTRREADEGIGRPTWSPAEQESRMRSSSLWALSGAPAGSSWRWMGRTHLGAADRPGCALGRPER